MRNVIFLYPAFVRVKRTENYFITGRTYNL